MHGPTAVRPYLLLPRSFLLWFAFRAPLFFFSVLLFVSGSGIVRVLPYQPTRSVMLFSFYLLLL
jgi:hypothetical protein